MDLYTGLNNQNSATSTHQYLIIHHPKVGIIKLGYFLKMYQLSGNDNSQFFPLVYGGSLSNWNSSPYHGVAKWADTGSYSVSNRVIKSASPSFKSENDNVSFFHLSLPPL